MTIKKLRRHLARQLIPTGLPLPVRAKLAKLACQHGGRQAHLGHLALAVAWGQLPAQVQVHLKHVGCGCGCGGHFVATAVTGPKASVLVGGVG